jgi:putative MFS transporter
MLYFGAGPRVGDDAEDETDRLLRRGSVGGAYGEAAAGEAGGAARPPPPSVGDLIFGDGVGAVALGRPGSYSYSGGGSAGGSGGSAAGADYGYRMLDDCIAETEGPLQTVLSVLLFLANFVDAMETMMLSMLMPVLAADFGLSESGLALIPALTTVGMLVGVALFSRVADSLGRKAAFVSAMAVVIVCGFGSSFARNVTSFAVARMFLGVGYGGNLLAGTTLLLEFLSAERRARVAMVTGVGFGVGALVIVLVGWVVLPSLGWQWLPRIASLVGLPVLATLFWIPESPRFYVMRGEFAKSVKVMEQVARFNGKELPAYYSATTLAVVHHEEQTEEAGRGNAADCWGLAQLNRWVVLKTLLPLTGVWFLNSFAVSIFAWLPLHGHKTFIGREDVVFQTALCGAAGMLAGNIWEALAVDWGSRLTQLRVSLLLEGLVWLLLAAVGLSSYGAFLAFTFATQFIEQIAIMLLYLYTPEAFPTRLRARAFGIGMLAHRIAPIPAPFVIAALDKVGFNVTCIVFGAIFLLAALLATTLTVQTGNRALIEETDLQQEETKAGRAAAKAAKTQRDSPAAFELD